MKEKLKDTIQKWETAALSLSATKAKVPNHLAKKVYGRKYVSYGEDNTYPDFLLSLKAQAEHNAILDSKIDWLTRSGFDLEKLSPDQQKWFVDNDMDSLIYKLAYDYETYGGFCFYVVKSRSGKEVAQFEYEDFAKVRLAIDPEEGEEYLVGEDWSKYRTETEVIPKWKPDGKEPKSLYYYAGPKTEYYPVPSYFGAVSAIQTMIELDVLQLNLVQNGFFVPTVISFKNGIPDEEAQEEIGNQIKNAFTGADNAGELLVLWNNPGDEAVQIDTLETTNLDEKFKSVIDQKLQSIYSGHRITNSALFGVKTAGELGSKKELIDAWELFQKNYIQPRQEMLTGIIAKVLAPNWAEMDLYLLGVEVIEPDVPEEQLFQNMTLEERREQLGLADEELSEDELTRMKVAELPQSAQDMFYASLGKEELHRMVGYEAPAETPLELKKQAHYSMFVDNFADGDMPAELWIELYDQYVDSSNLLYVEYMENIEYLFVTFRSGATYSYLNVPKEVVDGMMDAASKGSYFYYNIRTSYTYQRIA